MWVVGSPGGSPPPLGFDDQVMTNRKKDFGEEKIEDSLEIFQDESDRACAVLGTACLEFLLAKLIEKNLPNANKRSKNKQLMVP